MFREDGAADRAVPRRRADDRHRRRFEHGPKRRADARVVAEVDRLAVSLVRADRELDPDLASVVRTADLEARVLEHFEHRPVLGHHLGHEALDADPPRFVGDPLEKAGGDAVGLAVVGDDERHLRQARVAQAREAGDADDPVGLVGAGGHGDQDSLAAPVRIEKVLDHRVVDPARAMEPQAHAGRREIGQEAPHGVRRPRSVRRTQAERAPASQDDIVNALPGGAHLNRP